MKTQLFFLFLVACFCAFSQETKSIENIKGSALVSGDVSPNQAKLAAINDAKLKALKVAGIEEQISSYQLLFSSQEKNDFSQFFASDIQSELQGAVRSYTIKEEKLYCKNEFEIVSEVVLDAVVIRYTTKPDPAYDAKIEGIRGAYVNGENLTFKVRPTQTTYLSIFNITDSDASLLFPSPYEKSFQLVKSELYDFPRNKVDYTLSTENKKTETNRLIFVFTKTYIPFIRMDKNQSCSREDIFSWIYAIPPDQRKVEYFAFNVAK